MNYYNENDPKAAAWLRALIAAGLIPDGYVDERSIVDVQPGDLGGYDQCHFFAGIGGWSVALALAEWPAGQQVWTGSCPCQPFSQAGKRKGHEDERHLWPAFCRLIRECRPLVVFGEQVESAVGHGWLDGVCADLEGEGYAIGAVVLGAHSVGAPHIRQRLYWVADSGCQRDERRGESGELADARGSIEGKTREWERGGDAAGDCVPAHRLGHTDNPGPQGRRGGPDGEPDAKRREAAERFAGLPGVFGGLGVADCAGRDSGQSSAAPAGHGDSVESAGGVGGLGNAQGDDERRDRVSGEHGKRIATGGSGIGFWDDFRIIPCGDGKARRVGSGVQPLADGLSYDLGGRRNGRAALLKGSGNAIVPQVAAEFIRAFMSL